jgi:glycosyltransferase involved in cell wall biosynthesis
MEDGAIQVQDANELETALAKLLSDEARREQLGHNAHKVVRKNLGAIDRTVDMIVEHLDHKEHYVAPPVTAEMSAKITAAPPEHTASGSVAN